MHRKQITVGLIILTLICSFGYCCRRKSSDLDDPILFSHTPPKEYLELFSEKSQKLMIFDETDYFKKEFPISGFYFDQKKYVLQVYKLGKVDDVSLKNIIVIKNELTNMPSGGLAYRNYVENLFLVMYRPNQKELKNITLNLYQDSSKMVANCDSMISIYSRFKSFSLQYNKKDTLMMFGKPGDFHSEYSNSSMPLITTFLKKNHALYLIIMSLNKPALMLQPSSTVDLINGIKIGT